MKASRKNRWTEELDFLARQLTTRKTFDGECAVSHDLLPSYLRTQAAAAKNDGLLATEILLKEAALAHESGDGPLAATLIEELVALDSKGGLV